MAPRESGVLGGTKEIVAAGAFSTACCRPTNSIIGGADGRWSRAYSIASARLSSTDERPSRRPGVVYSLDGELAGTFSLVAYSESSSVDSTTAKDLRAARSVVWAVAGVSAEGRARSSQGSSRSRQCAARGMRDLEQALGGRGWMIRTQAELSAVQTCDPHTHTASKIPSSTLVTESVRSH